jgi:hypothetical protein
VLIKKTHVPVRSQEVPSCNEFGGNVDSHQDEFIFRVGRDQHLTSLGDCGALNKHPPTVFFLHFVGNHLPDEARTSVGPIGYAEVAFWSVTAAIALAHGGQFDGQERDPPRRAPIVAFSRVVRVTKLTSAYSRYSSGPSTTTRFWLLGPLVVNLPKRPCMNDPMKNVAIWEEEAATLSKCWAPATTLVQISPTRRTSSYLSITT